MKTLLKLSSFILLLSLASCTTTRVTSSWVINNPPTNAMQKVLVLGVMSDREQRNNIEQSMVAEFGRSGINAVSATTIFGPNGFRGLTEDQIDAKLKEFDFTSVMIVSLVAKDRQTTFHPGTFYVMPRPMMGRSFYYRRFMFAHDVMFTPAFVSTSTNFILQADLFTIEPDELIYSAQTRTYDPSNARALATSFSREIVSQMRTKRLIP